jgi:hypothetical protein
MPSRSRVEALETFYASGAAVRENMQAPNSGRAKVIYKERPILKGHRRVAAMPFEGVDGSI